MKWIFALLVCAWTCAVSLADEVVVLEGDEVGTASSADENGAEAAAVVGTTATDEVAEPGTVGEIGGPGATESEDADDVASPGMTDDDEVAKDDASEVDEAGEADDAHDEVITVEPK